MYVGECACMYVETCLCVGYNVRIQDTPQKLCDKVRMIFMSHLDSESCINIHPVINHYIATSMVMFQSAARLYTRLYGFRTHDTPPELCMQNAARHFEQQSEQHNLRERDHWGDPNVDGRIILRRIFRK